MPFPASTLLPAARFRDEIGGTYVLVETEDNSEVDDDSALDSIVTTDCSWAEFPDYDVLSKQSFAPERPGPGKYGDPRLSVPWGHYVTNKAQHAINGSRAAELPSRENSSAQSLALVEGGSNASDQPRVRLYAYAHSCSRWRNELNARVPAMATDEPSSEHEINFAPKSYGPSSIGSSGEENAGLLIVPSSKLELFETTPQRVVLRQLDGYLRFPIFQPSSGRAEIVRATGVILLERASVKPA
jgi:hypothetical protein